jgi:glucose/arabinose dehydrogenase
MKHIVALGLAAALIACSESPKPATKAPPPPASAPVTAAPQPQPQPEPPKPDPNKELAAKVKQALEAPNAKLPAGGIDVTAADGKVSLWGTVETDQQRRRAALIAGKVDGVKGVDNQLKVVKGS